MNEPLNNRLNVNVEITSSTSAKITWDGNSAAQYTVAYWEFPQGDESIRLVQGNETGFSGLKTGVRYSVRVTGGSRQGGTTFVPYEVPDKPEKPRKIRFVGVDFNDVPDGIWVHWAMASGEVDGYKLTYYPVGDPDDKTTVARNKYQTAYPAAGLSREGDGKYIFSVVACTPDGESEPTQVLTSTLSEHRPSQLGGLETSEQGRTSITIRWEKLPDAATYEVSSEDMERPNIQEETTATFDNLQPGTNYVFRVAPLSSPGVMGGGSYWTGRTQS